MIGAWRRFRRHRAALAGAGVVVVITVAALAAPLLAPHEPGAILDAVRLPLQSPGSQHLLGTDALSRDVLSRLLYGARVSLAAGLAAAVLAASIAGLVGFAAGLGGPRLDAVLMRGVDMLLALPRLLLVMVVFAFWDGMSLLALVLLLGATGWFPLARLVRERVRALAQAEFAVAARALGGGRRHVARHLWPHVAATLIVGATLDIGNIILLEAGLSFLGLGVAPPAPTWGNMILEGRAVIFSAPWIALAPGIALVVTATAFNLVGDGLRDALHPGSR